MEYMSEIYFSFSSGTGSVKAVASTIMLRHFMQIAGLLIFAQVDSKTIDPKDVIDIIDIVYNIKITLMHDMMHCITQVMELINSLVISEREICVNVPVFVMQAQEIIIDWN